MCSLFLSCICLINFLLYFLIAKVRLHLLTAVMKCFFKRPPETQKALGAALTAGLADFHQVRQYLYLYVFVIFMLSKFLVFVKLWSIFSNVQ